MYAAVAAIACTVTASAQSGMGADKMGQDKMAKMVRMEEEYCKVVEEEDAVAAMEAAADLNSSLHLVAE